MKFQEQVCNNQYEQTGSNRNAWIDWDKQICEMPLILSNLISLSLRGSMMDSRWLK